MLTGKGKIRAWYDFKKGKRIIRAGCGSKRSSVNKILIPLHLSNNFEIQKYYQNDPTFNGVYSINSLHKINDGA